MKLTPEDIAAIKEATDESIADLARRFKVSESAINYHRRTRILTTVPKKEPVTAPSGDVIHMPQPLGPPHIPKSWLRDVTIENGVLILRIPISELILNTI